MATITPPNPIALLKVRQILIDSYYAIAAAAQEAAETSDHESHAYMLACSGRVADLCLDLAAFRVKSMTEGKPCS